ncbi:hypothetical protein CsSME_00052425 [Camellia sinensis var. sinensis]
MDSCSVLILDSPIDKDKLSKNFILSRLKSFLIIGLLPLICLSRIPISSE